MNGLSGTPPGETPAGGAGLIRGGVGVSIATAACGVATGRGVEPLPTTCAGVAAGVGDGVRGGCGGVMPGATRTNSGAASFAPSPLASAPGMLCVLRYSANFFNAESKVGFLTTGSPVSMVSSLGGSRLKVPVPLTA